jgi:hypothetical protein
MPGPVDLISELAVSVVQVTGDPKLTALPSNRIGRALLFVSKRSP